MVAGTRPWVASSFSLDTEGHRAALGQGCQVGCHLVRLRDVKHSNTEGFEYQESHPLNTLYIFIPYHILLIMNYIELHLNFS